jgi:hypothetical protein
MELTKRFTLLADRTGTDVELASKIGSGLLSCPCAGTVRECVARVDEEGNRLRMAVSPCSQRTAPLLSTVPANLRGAVRV